MLGRTRSSNAFDRGSNLLLLSALIIRNGNRLTDRRTHWPTKNDMTLNLKINIMDIFSQPMWKLHLIIGRPTIEGKMNSGKLLPAKPHFTNPVPLSHTITRFPSLSVMALLLLLLLFLSLLLLWLKIRYCFDSFSLQFFSPPYFIHLYLYFIFIFCLFLMSKLLALWIVFLLCPFYRSWLEFPDLRIRDLWNWSSKEIGFQYSWRNQHAGY